ncbi:MAG: hypothetical protein ACK5M7_07320 [Draconibacterium sp.]
MDKVEFETFIELKIRDIVDLIMECKDFDFEIAIQYLYKSALYRLLLKEETKLWHLSSEKLVEMLIDEKENKQLVFPDYV